MTVRELRALLYHEPDDAKVFASGPDQAFPISGLWSNDNGREIYLETFDPDMDPEED